MPKWMANLNWHGLKIGLGVFLFGLLLLSLPALAQTKDEPKAPTPPAKGENQSTFGLKVRSDLVVVRVVVRDGQGKPLEGLKKEDFRLFDRGKEQSIAQFEEEKAVVAPPPASSALPNRSVNAAAIAPAVPQRFLTLYFDDLDMSDTDVIDARDAADHYLSASLQPGERVALLTSSATLSDFTNDPKQIHDALSRLHAHPHSGAHTDCPEISDYQALEISEHDDPNSSDAWKAALDEAMMRCRMSAVEDFPVGANPPETIRVEGLSKHPTADTVAFVQNMARTILAQAEMRARTSLLALERVANYTAQMPGQRSIILVSPGFLSRTEQYDLDRVIDRALRAQVVISSLDPRGLALLMREADVTSNYTPSANSGAIGSLHAADTNREFAGTDVLSEVAEGTGGEYFHNNNDLTAGFRALAGSQGSYILAFAPSDIKPDGRFHSLKVTLAEKHAGLHLRARRGYFAPKGGTEAESEARQASSDAEAQEAEQIREAILAKTEMQELPVALGAKLSQDTGETRDLALLAHLDARPLHFHKDGEHNLNTVIFVFAIFDEKGDLVTTQERRAHIDLPDAKLTELAKAGVDVDMTFKLKPGIYRVREVVTESEEHHMTTFSRRIQVQ